MRTLLAGLLLVSSYSMAGWDMGADDDSWFAMVESNEYRNVYLGIFYAPSNNCEPKIMFVTVLEKDWLEEVDDKREIKYRIDKGAVYYGESNHVIQKHKSGSYNYREINGLKLTTEQEREIALGTRLVMSPDDTAVNENVSYPLQGSASAMAKADNACHAADSEWGNSPTKVPAYSGDEWSA